MAMQITWVFSDFFGLNSWSEVHYSDDVDFSRWLIFGFADGADLSPNGKTWLRMRRRLMPRFAANPSENVYVRKIRFSVLGQARNSYVYSIPPDLSTGTFGTATPPVEVWTRLICTVRTDQPIDGRFFLGGVPESQLLPPNQYDPEGSWPRDFRAYINQLSAFNIGIRSRKPLAGAQNPVYPVVPINAFNADGTGRNATIQPIGIGAAGATPPLTGQCILRGRHPSEWNGIHRYTLTGGTPPTLIQLGPSRRPLGDWAPQLAPNAGTIQFYAPQIPHIRSATPLRFESRDTGGPFVRHPGRRRRAL